MRVLETLGFAALAATLYFYAWRLGKDAHDTNIRINSPIRASSRRLVFSGEEGIDIFGNVVHPLPPTAARATLVFLLHTNHLSNDIRFWTDISQSLPKDSGIRLVGYCDGPSCASTLRSERSLPFPVIEFGETIGSQALIDADRNGECLLREEMWFSEKRLHLQGRPISPKELAKEILDESLSGSGT